MSTKKKFSRPEYDPTQKVLVSASDLTYFVAHAYEMSKMMEEQGYVHIAKGIRESSDRMTERLYKSGYWRD